MNVMEKETIILILITLSTLCFAQKESSEALTPAKPSTTACPTWNKKSKSSKAAYFEYLRSPKTKINQQTTISKSQKVQSRKAVQKNENATQKESLNPAIKQASQTNAPSMKEAIATSTKPEKQESISEVRVEEKKIEPSSAITPSAEGSKEETKEETKDKDKTETSKLKKKLIFMSRKTTKVHKHSNAKCPSF